MATVGDIYQIRDYQVMAGDLGNPFLNVYYYEVTATDSGIDADSVEVAFESVVGDSVITVQSVSLQHTLHEVINLMDPTDFTSVGFTPPAGQGTVGGSYVSNANCWSFIYRRATRSVRNGWKRIGGLAELSISNGGADPSTLPDLNAVAVNMESPLNVAFVDLLPRIVRVSGPTGGPFTYTAFPITGVDYVRIGTQNTRKR